MAEQKREGLDEGTAAQNPEAETFKREGPTPPGNSTGNSIDDMNRAAEESLVRNIRPDEGTG
jgi:hypothetical protein